MYAAPLKKVVNILICTNKIFHVDIMFILTFQYCNNTILNEYSFLYAHWRCCDDCLLCCFFFGCSFLSVFFSKLMSLVSVLNLPQYFFSVMLEF